MVNADRCATGFSLGIGLKQCRVSTRTTLRLAWHFGLFQFFMPILGWLAGLSLAHWISSVDHWIAFGLLAAIGGKMIYEALWGDEEKRAATDATRGSSLVVLSVATSIDALAVGLSLALLGVPIWYPAVIIGVVAFGFTAAGLHLGCRFGSL
ncbi:MAG TPA: manganese efflux pump MntP family protein, partial [Candidatus Limnocylindrales bacterium]